MCGKGCEGVEGQCGCYLLNPPYGRFDNIGNWIPCGCQKITNQETKSQQDNSVDDIIREEQ